MVENEEGEFHVALMNAVAESLQITPSRPQFPDADEDDDYLEFVDRILFAGDTVYYVEAKERLSRDDVAKALLAKRMVEIGRGGEQRAEFILMAKKVPARVKEIANAVGVIVVQLGMDFPLPSRKSSSGGRISKLSHPRSWQIVTRLLWSGPSSIRHLSKVEAVSYSWTHATVTRLMDMGVAERSSTGVRIVDLGRLMDGISWERPLNRLLVEEIPVSGADYMEVAQELEAILNKWNVGHAFTAFTAGGIYTGHGQRFDRLNILSGAEGGLSGLAVQDIYTTGWRELLIELRQQSLAVEKQMITVQKENRINRPARQIRIPLLSENGWHRDAGRKRLSFILLCGPFLQDNLLSFTGRVFKDWRD